MESQAKRRLWICRDLKCLSDDAPAVRRRLFHGRGGADTLVLDNIVNHASAELALVLKAKYDPNQVDHLRHAEELAHFAQSIESTATSVGREVVAAHVDTPVQRKELRRCYGCGKTGHIQVNGRSKASGKHSGGRKRNNGGGGDGGMVLAVTDIMPRSRGKRACYKHISARESVNAICNSDVSDKSAWILDSGSSRHFVNDSSLLTDPTACSSECLTAATDGNALRSPYKVLWTSKSLHLELSTQ